MIKRSMTREELINEFEEARARFIANDITRLGCDDPVKYAEAFLNDVDPGGEMFSATELVREWQNKLGNEARGAAARIRAELDMWRRLNADR